MAQRLAFTAALACLAVPPGAAQAQTFTLLHGFTAEPDGDTPAGGPVFYKGLVYGTTLTGGATDNGSVYAVDPKNGSTTILYSFAGGTDGAQPEGDLLLHKGLFYGTTSFGGTFNAGTIFQADPTTGIEKILYSFGSGADGAAPPAGLVAHGDALYGTTTGGGEQGLGTVFQFDLGTGTETVLHSFAGGDDGSKPFAGLVYNKGFLYGDSFFGGAANNGVVFRIDAKTGDETLLHAFTGKSFEGNPSAGLLYDSGTLYGTTAHGGIKHCGGSTCGTVFKVDAGTGATTTLYSFQNQKDGEDPEGGLVLLGGMLYGATMEGGGPGLGTLFKLDPATGAQTVLHIFKGAPDGQNPGTLKLHGGVIYGSARAGGPGGFGSVFKLVP